MNAFAVFAIDCAPPKRILGWSIASTISRPVVEPSLVLNPSGGAGTGGASPDGCRDTHSAVTTRRGFPSIRTTKSAGERLVIGLPVPSTTDTSSDATSTDDRNRGGSCGCCSAETVRLKPDTTEASATEAVVRR